eukprot:gb/GECG01003503.1/.p1 GENE.gb/GECG01003503.1/~~gb/GECG01003503.1/.p1  ORF type:complete len:864 (+),score=192.00 gb/GECG01003503.1/:1-2592(+)
MSHEQEENAEYPLMEDEEEEDKERQRLEEEQKRVIEEQRAARQKAQEKRNRSKNKANRRRPKVELEDREALLQNLEAQSSSAEGAGVAAAAPPVDEEDEAWSAQTSKVTSQLESARENASTEVNKLRQEQQHVETGREEENDDEAEEVETQPQEDEAAARQRILEQKEDEVFSMLTELFESVQEQVDTQKLFSRIKKASSSFRKGKSSAKQYYDHIDGVISTVMHAKYASTETPSREESKKILLKRYQFMEQLMPYLAETVPARISENGEEKKKELLDAIREASRIHAQKRAELENQAREHMEREPPRRYDHGGSSSRWETSQSGSTSKDLSVPVTERASHSAGSTSVHDSGTTKSSSASASTSHKQPTTAAAEDPLQQQETKKETVKTAAKTSSTSNSESKTSRDDKPGTAEVRKHSAASEERENMSTSVESASPQMEAQAPLKMRSNDSGTKPASSIASKLQEARANAATETQHGSLPAKTAHSYLYNYPVAYVPYDQGILSITMYGAQTEKEPQSEKEYVSYIIQCQWNLAQDEDQEESSETNTKREWVVARRYREFDALHEEINDILDDYVASRKYFGKDTSSVDPSKLPSLPRKTWSKGTDPKVIADRKLGLARYIKELVEGFPLVLHMNPVDDFFMLTDRLRDVRRRKRGSDSRGIQHFGAHHGQRQPVSLIEAIRRKLDRLGSSEEELAVPPFWEQGVKVYGDYGAQVLVVRELPEERSDIIPPSDVLKENQQESIPRLIKLMEKHLDKAQKSNRKSTYLKNLIWQLLRCEAFVAYKYLENTMQAATDEEQRSSLLNEPNEEESGASACAASDSIENRSAKLMETFLDQRERLQTVLGQHEDEMTAVALAEQYSAE